MSGLRVLVVDDDVDITSTMATMLHLLGHETRVATDGLAALQAAEEDQPDVVLLDIGLPKLDGWEVAKRIRELRTPKRPFLIAISGYGQEVHRLRSREAGVDLHLVKPVDPALLQAMLARFHALIAPCEE